MRYRIAPLARRVAAAVMVVAATAMFSGDGTAADKRNAIAVVIGNKNYDGLTPEVSFAINDADAFRRFIVERLGFDPDNIIDLRNANYADFVKVFGNQNTAEGRLKDYVGDDRPDVVVFYSGHGAPGP